MAGLHQHEAFNLTKRLLDSPYYEPDPGKADYYWIPSTGRPVNRSTPALLIEHVRRTYPWWNMTKARGEARCVRHRVHSCRVGCRVATQLVAGLAAGSTL